VVVKVVLILQTKTEGLVVLVVVVVDWLVLEVQAGLRQLALAVKETLEEMVRQVTPVVGAVELVGQERLAHQAVVPVG
jgi:hypothetical protein